MNITKKALPLLILFASSHQALAASDPLKWNLSQNFPNQILVAGGTYVASYSFTSELPFVMANPLTIKKDTNSPSEVSYQDLCTGKKLTPLESCTVTIYLNPTTLGPKTVQLTELYGNNQVPLPPITTRASSSNGGSLIAGSVTTALPQTLDMNTATPWKFTFTNNGTSNATGLNLFVSGSSYNSNCGLSLSSTLGNNTCYVQGTYSATAAGPHTISATLSYAQGAAVALSTSTTVTAGSSGLSCTAAVPLAPETLINTSNPVTLLCTNQTDLPLTNDSHTTSYPTGGAEGTFTPNPSGGDNCTAQTLQQGASCQLQGTYASPSSAHNGINISLLVNYHTPSASSLTSQTATTTNVVTQITNARTLTLVNNCNFEVWWSMVGGAITDTPACTSNADCPTGSTCNVSAKICYYNNYGPKTGSYGLQASGGTATTQIIETQASTISDQILWKGLISASTQCNGASCQNNSCQNNGGTTSCAVGVGFQQPATEAEFALQLTGASHVDTYDISNVNGFSIPISMGTNQSVSNYSCGTAGNNLASGSLKACSFSHVTPPTNMYYWVTSTGTACTAQNTCSASYQICGLAFNDSSNSFVKNCGDFLGYWAASQICQTNPNFTSPFGDNFNCNQLLGSPFPANTYTLTQLFKCSPPVSNAPLFNSCYLSYSGYSSTQLAQCCGCTNWNGIATPTASCPAGQVDPQWTTYVQPLIQWMKQACPTSYSYPYDDKASTFQCAASQATEYTITFCPGGGTGLPNGKAEGR